MTAELRDCHLTFLYPYPHEFNVNDLCMPCFLIDVSNKAHDHYSVTSDDIDVFEKTYGKISQNSCVMIKTGWERFWKDPEKYHNNHIFPSVSITAANLLLQRGVMALGIDTLSPDRSEDGFEVHQAFLGKINKDYIFVDLIINNGR